MNRQYNHTMNKTIIITSKLRAMLTKVVTCARQGDYPDAASHLNCCAQMFTEVLEETILPHAQLQKLAYSLETMVMLQQQDDWVGVADVLEFEFVKLLDQV
jgi:hypothetical protein